MIKKIKNISGEKRVGHAGTLDPLAEGVLVVAVGREDTKKLHLLQKSDKEYLCEMELGRTSLTGDAEGPISFSSDHEPDLSNLDKVLAQFVGLINQKPHRFSALKVGGKKSYQVARKGGDLNLKPRKVSIKEIKLLSYNYPIISLRVVCGPGVYIRSLAEDIGQALGVGAYLKNLKRTRVGEFKEEDTIKI